MDDKTSLRSSEEYKEVWGAVIRAKSKMEPVAKNTANPFYKSKYADYATIWEAVFPILQSEKLDVTAWPTSKVLQLTNSVVLEVILTTRITHLDSGEWLEFDTSVPTPKVEPQGFGMTVTYARRYSIMPFLGIVTEDDDGNYSSQKTVKKPQLATQQQLNEIKKLVKEYGETDEAALSQAVSNNKANTYKELTTNEAGKAINGLKKRLAEKNKPEETKEE